MVQTDHSARRQRGAGLTTVVRLLPRRWSYERAVILPVVVALIIMSVTVAATPRYLNRLTDRALKQLLTSASPDARGIDIVLTDRIDSGGATVVDEADRRGATYVKELPPELRSIIGPVAIRVESPRLSLVADDGRPLYESAWHYPAIRFSSVPGMDQRVRLLRGRLPAPREPVVAPATIETATGGSLLPVFEVALTPATAEALRMQVGDRVLVRPDPSDPLADGIATELIDVRAYVELTGLIAVDPNDEFAWDGARQLQRPTVSQLGDKVYIDATGLLAADLYRGLAAFTAPIAWRYTWHLGIDPTRVDAGQVPGLIWEVERLQRDGGPTTVLTDSVTNVTIQTNFAGVLEQHQQQSRLLQAILLIAGIGVGALGIVVLVQLATVLHQRRRATLTLVRRRGASLFQLTVVQLLEGLVFIAPVIVIGYLGAQAAVVARASPWSLRGATALGGLFLVLLLANVRRRVQASDGRDDGGDGRRSSFSRPGPRLIVRDGLAVLLAGVSLVALHQRGVATNGASKAAVSDPLLAAAPILVATAAGLVALRVYPRLGQAGSRIASRQRRLVPFLGLRCAAEPPNTARATLLTIVVAVAIGTMFLSVTATVTHIRQDVAWRTVGADYQIIPPPGSASLPGNVDLAIPHEEVSTTTAFIVPDASVASVPILLIAIDPAELTAVTAGTPAGPQFPNAFRSQSVSSGVPAIASAALVAATAEIGTVSLGSVEIPIEIVDRRVTFAGVATDLPWLLVPLEALRAAAPDSDLQVSHVYVRGGRDVAARLMEGINAQGIDAQVRSRRVVEQELDTPLVAGTRVGFGLATLVATVFAIATSLTGVILTLDVRRRNLLYLSTLGLARRQATVLFVLEHAPLVVFGVVVGVGTGFGICHLVIPQLDLGVLAGSRDPVTLEIPWVSIGMSSGMFTTIIVGLGALVLLLVDRAEPTRLLRFSDS